MQDDPSKAERPFSRFNFAVRDCLPSTVRIGDLLGRLKRSDRMVGLIDQGLQASVKFVAILVFARWLTQEDFGIFALATASSFLLVGVQYAIVVLPFIVSCPTAKIAEENRGHWFWLHLMLVAVAVACLGVILTVLTLIDSAAWLQDTAKFTLVLAPLLLNYQFSRRYFYQTMNFGLTLKMSIANFVFYGLGIAVVVFVAPTAWAAMLAYASALLAGMAVAFFGDRPPSYRSAKGMFAAWSRSKSFAGWMLLSRLVRQVNFQLMSFILAALAGPASVATFTLTRSLIQPTGVLIAGVDMIDKPRAGRAYAKDGISGLQGSISRTRQFLLMSGLPYLLLLLAFANEIIALVYGPNYADFGKETRLWIAVALVNLLEQPLNSQMVMMRRTRVIFLCNALSACITVGLAAAFIGDHGVLGAIIAVLGGRVVSVALLFAATKSLHRTQHGQSD